MPSIDFSSLLLIATKELESNQGGRGIDQLAGSGWGVVLKLGSTVAIYQGGKNKNKNKKVTLLTRRMEAMFGLSLFSCTVESESP